MLTILNGALRAALMQGPAPRRPWDPPAPMRERPGPLPRREADRKRRLMAIMELGGRPPV